MSANSKRIDFLATEEGIVFIQSLRGMMSDATYNTQAGYSSNKELYPDNSIPFDEQHVEYIASHPAVNPQHYLSNLRIMTRIR